MPNGPEHGGRWIRGAEGTAGGPGLWAELRVHDSLSAAEVSGEMDTAEVKVEEFDGTYACVICSESVRGGDALHCAQCSSNPVHVTCVRGSPFAETCAQCSGKTMRPWTGRAGGGAPSSATIDLVAAEVEPAASGKGKELDDAEKLLARGR